MQTGEPGSRPLLAGDEVAQISLDPNGLQLALGRARISIFVPLDLEAGGRSSRIDPAEHTGDFKPLWDRLYVAIREVRVLERRVEIDFDDGAKLATDFVDEPYENGTIEYSEPKLFEVF